MLFYTRAKRNVPNMRINTERGGESDAKGLFDPIRPRKNARRTYVRAAVVWRTLYLLPCK